MTTDEHTRRIQELEEELAHVQRLAELGQAVSALIHEIAQPITAIKNYLNAFHRLTASDNQAGAQTALERMEEHANHASDIIRRIRDYVKKRDVQMQPEVLSNVISEAVVLAGASIRDDDVTLTVEVDPSVQLAEIDRIVVRQVLFNLMRNSLEAMQDQPKRGLTISAKEVQDQMVEISVADTGPGLSHEVRRKLFQPFVTTKPDGMGVGLSVCQVVVKRHGGRLWADDNIGGGTVFRFTINRRQPSTVRPG
jgi:two-component system sensor kinase FixL